VNAIVRHWDAIRTAVAAEKAEVRGLIDVGQTAFLPAALEIIERPVSPTARFTSRLLLGSMAVTLLWLTFGRIDVVASASGKLIPIDSVKLVQPAQAGIVRSILVTDNQRVRKGQPLVDLDPTASTADTAQAEKQLETAQLDAARARAVLSSLDGKSLRFVPPPGTPADVASVQVALARAELANIRGAAVMHGGDMQAAVAARAEAAGQVTKLTETLPLLDVQINAYEGLLAKGFVSRLRVVEMQRQRLAAARDRDIAVDTMRKADAQIRSADGGMAQAGAEARVQVLADLAKAEAEAKLRREELVKATQTSSLQRLSSPADGMVTQLSVHTVGGVVEAAKPIMAIVPAGGALVAEVKILNRDIGFVRVGQPVAVKLSAFPFTRYGVVEGRVDSLSSDAIDDEKLGLVYVGRVSLNRRMLQRDGQTVTLNPGMELAADIRTGRRSIMSYLLSPINEASRNAGHEQ
jgi:hemolysin D